MSQLVTHVHPLTHPNPIKLVSVFTIPNAELRQPRNRLSLILSLIPLAATALPRLTETAAVRWS